jgi:hypothetical protein
MTAGTAEVPKNSVAPSRGKILTVLLMVPVLCTLASAPGMGCLRTASLAVDDALFTSELSGVDRAKAMDGKTQSPCSTPRD